ncbi:MAG TPA: efflux RND transporter periplasmic adaptor subunit [Bryobacteraceae bacterium]|jgi:RND family efflux transporter MFP subunit
MADSQHKTLPPAEEPPLLEAPAEERLRAEIDALKKQLEEERKKKDQPEKPKPRTLWIIAGIIVVLLLLAFFIGYLPAHRRNAQLKEEAQAEAKALPVVAFVKAEAATPSSQLLLPGNMQPVTEAPILARAEGYLKTRYVDIGDRVKKGQLLAEIEAPDLDQQVAQARAQLMQASASLQQSVANLNQGEANQQLSHVTAVRWAALLKRGAVSRQENDQYQAQDLAQIATVKSLGQAVHAAEQNVSAVRANLDRLVELQSYEHVRAPFDGVITLRNVDVGALIGTGNTLLFRIAQTGTLRIFIYTPQSEAPTIQPGQPADIHVSEYPARTFHGAITRTSESLDPQSRTLLTEVQVANGDGTLLPGMFANVTLMAKRADRPMMVPGSALLVRSNGSFVAVLEDAGDNQGKSLDMQRPQNAKGSKTKDAKQDGKSKGEAKPAAESPKQEKKQIEEDAKLPEFVVHIVPVSVGRDFGSSIEILTGLKGGERVVQAPTDDIQQNAHVRATLAKPSEAGAKQSSNSEQLVNQPGAEKAPKPAGQGKQDRAAPK